MRQLRKLEDGKMFQLTAQRSRLQYYTHSKLDITHSKLDITHTKLDITS